MVVIYMANHNDNINGIWIGDETDGVKQNGNLANYHGAIMGYDIVNITTNDDVCWRFQTYYIFN